MISSQKVYSAMSMPVLLLCHKEQLAKGGVGGFLPLWVSGKREMWLVWKRILSCKLLVLFRNSLSCSPITGSGRVTPFLPGHIQPNLRNTEYPPKRTIHFFTINTVKLNWQEALFYKHKYSEFRIVCQSRTHLIIYGPWFGQWLNVSVCVHYIKQGKSY